MKADMILYSNAIFDAVGDEPFAGGIAIEGKKIAAVGTREEIKQYENDTCEIIELGDQMILPGFIDSHGHYPNGASYYGEVALHDMEQYTSEEACAKAIGEFAAAHPEQKLIKGQGWYLSRWGADAQFPTAASIDKYVSDRPVYMVASDLHSIWLNTRAMEESGLKEKMKNLKDEYVLKDAKGNPTGVVREASMAVMDSLLSKYALTEEEQERKDAEDQAALMHALNEQGITGFADVSFVLPDALKATYRHMKALDEKDEMSIRLYIYPGTQFKAELIKDIVPYEEYYTSDELHIAGVKNILDGVTATFTAVMLKPYTDAPDKKGVPATDQEHIDSWVAEANRLGYSCRIHCIGDGAVRMALDAYEKSGKINDTSNMRNAIEHIEVIDPTDIPRFGKLGVVASMQPRHQILDRGEKLYRCGLERSKYEWAFKSIMNGGGRIALGTDYPVVIYNTYENIYMGVTKKDLDGTQYGTLSLNEKLTLAEALKGYTSEGAYLNGMEDKVGTIEVGKYADLTIANANLFAIDIEEIKNCFSVMTIFNGKVVFKK